MKTKTHLTRTCGAFLACVLLGMSAASAGTKAKAPENWDGLEPKKVKGLDHVYVRPNVEFAPYKSVQLDATQVEFQKNWEKGRDFQNRPTADDMQAIKAKVAEIMHDAFTQELVKHGYTIVDTPTEDTLLVSTAIIDLFINAPDLSSNPANMKSYTSSSGSMTLVLEARDGPTGQLLARVLDKRVEDNVGGRMEWTNRTTNMTDARRIMDEWAKRLRQALDRLNGKEGK